MQTPFLENLELDEESLRRESDFLARGRAAVLSGVHGANKFEAGKIGADGTTVRILKLEGGNVPWDMTRVVKERKGKLIPSTGGGALRLYHELEPGSGGTMAGAGLADIQAEIGDRFHAGKRGAPGSLQDRGDTRHSQVHDGCRGPQGTWPDHGNPASALPGVIR